MSKAQTISKGYPLWQKVFYFFPIQLFIVHLKKNQSLIIYWLLLFLAIFQKLGVKYGVPYLFLAPEYLGKLNFWSYFIVGLSFGGFVMAFNISSYIMNGFRFPFLATMLKPFLKYTVNNSLFPFMFLICYSIQVFRFLNHYEHFTTLEIIYRLLGFFVGYGVFIVLSLSYFMATNKDLEKLFGKELSKLVGSDTKGDEPAYLLFQRKSREWFNDKGHYKTWRVDSYIGSRFRLRYTRRFSHYDASMLTQVFRQNHINASIFQLAVIASIIVLGYFRETQIFIIPAGATVFLLLTMFLMITSALRSWLRGWTVVILFGLLLSIHFISKYDTFYYQNRAYGLNYNILAPYPENVGDDYKERVKNNLRETEKTMNTWLASNRNGGEKPKAIFIANSGGGSRAATWSFTALQHLDSLTGGELFDHTLMITGSSGGMIGSAYFRELKRRALVSDTINPYDPEYRYDMAKDLLNPVMFTMAVNDMLIRTKRFEYEGEKYWKDRGYIFENFLNENTRGLLDIKLKEYVEPVKKGLLPRMIFTPSVLNDSRRMLISSQPMAFFTSAEMDSVFRKENVEYLHLFEQNDPLNVRYLSILRMTASFPYITPTVNMPTKPGIEIFDSGLRDNYGIKATVKYIFSIRKWLEQNTSGIIILQIRDAVKFPEKEDLKQREGILNELFSPFGNLYGNWFKVQDYNNDELLEYTKSWYQGPVHIFNYQLDKTPEHQISLSWHLTSREKNMIFESVNTPDNQQVLQHIQELLTAP